MTTSSASARSTALEQPAGGRTIADLWRGATAAPRSGPAYLVEAAGTWHEVSWADTARRVQELANGLLARGVGRGDRVAILGSTRLEWVQMDFALALVGAISVPIYATSSAEEARYIVEHSGAVGLAVEDDAQPHGLELPTMRHKIRFSELDRLADEGAAFAASHPHALDGAIAGLSENDVFTYQYTSGTTGPPKGCVVLNRNYVEMTRAVAALPGLIEGGEVLLLFLPLAHNFGRLLHLAGAHIGFTTALLADPQRVRDVLPAVRPTVLPSVPRIYEKMYAAVSGEFGRTQGLRRRVIDWALDVGRQAASQRERGAALPRGLARRHALADRLVYSKVKERLGGRLRVAISGGAPLSPEIGRFFHALDILILEGYGQSECTTACTVNLPGAVRFGTVGRAFPGFELRIADDGEVLVRSETVFAGYLNDEAATREAVDEDGWLHTGDIGDLDPDGYLRITDRKKDIIVTSGGKNVSPQNLENMLISSSEVVSSAVVIGDRRPYVTALITLDPDQLQAWARERGLDGDATSLRGHPALREALQEAVDRANAGLSRVEQIKRFAVLARDFSAAEGEVTPTLKLKRRVIEEHFAPEIDALYAA